MKVNKMTLSRSMLCHPFFITIKIRKKKQNSYTHYFNKNSRALKGVCIHSKKKKYHGAPDDPILRTLLRTLCTQKKKNTGIPYIADLLRT